MKFNQQKPPDWGAEWVLFYLGFLAVIGLVCVIILSIMGWPNTADTQLGILTKCGSIIAGTVAAGFVVYKLAAGWLIVNLSVDVVMMRVEKDGAFDHLSIHVKLEKGKTDALWLHEITLDLQDVDHLGIASAVRYFEYGSLNRSDGGQLCVSPEEKTQFAFYALVPKTSVIYARAIVHGSRLFYDFPQKHFSGHQHYIECHSTAISLPRPT